MKRANVDHKPERAGKRHSRRPEMAGDWAGAGTRPERAGSGPSDLCGLRPERAKKGDFNQNG